MKRIALGSLLAALSLGMMTVAKAATYDLINLVNNPVANFSGGFGQSVASGANTFVVDAVGNNAAYTFDAAGNLTHTLANPSGNINDDFGTSVAVSNGSYIVGSQFAATGESTQGAVYVFSSSGALTRTILDPNPATDGRFGCSVAANGTKVLVGARYSAGAAYLFDSTNGSLLRTFTHSTGGEFGTAVAWVGDNALIGASDAAYLFNQSGDLLQSFHVPGENFGFSVAGIGTDIFVGEPGAIQHRSDTTAGKVYQFSANNGQLVRTIQDPAATLGDLFGVSLAVVGSNQLLIGSSHYIPSAGAAYLFDLQGDLLHSYYASSTQGTGDNRFGLGLATLGNSVLIGAPGMGNGGTVSMYEGVPEPSTFALLSGLICAAGCASRRRKRTFRCGASA